VSFTFESVTLRAGARSLFLQNRSPKCWRTIRNTFWLFEKHFSKANEPKESPEIYFGPKSFRTIFEKRTPVYSLAAPLLCLGKSIYYSYDSAYLSYCFLFSFCENFNSNIEHWYKFAHNWECLQLKDGIFTFVPRRWMQYTCRKIGCSWKLALNVPRYAAALVLCILITQPCNGFYNFSSRGYHGNITYNKIVRYKLNETSEKTRGR